MLIKNGRVINPNENIEEVLDVKIKDGIILEIGENLKSEQNEEVIDATGKVVAPGLVDIHVHFRTPGQEYKEDLETGAAAAAKGGYTSVICMANTIPRMDNPKVIRDFYREAKKSKINIYSISALTENFNGKDIVNMEEMAKNGAVGFSDDGIPDKNADVILKAMENAKKLDMPISFHEEDPSLIAQNGINHGEISEKLGIYGSPRAAEDVYVARDSALAIYTGAKIDIQHISSAIAADYVRMAKRQGAKIYAEVTPHHFTLNENAVLKYGSLAKMNPPLRTEEDRRLIIEAIKDNTIEIIATDHAPHAKEEKEKELIKAPSGIIGLETALGLGIRELVLKKHITLMELLRKMTINPAKLYKLPAGKIEKGEVADIVIFDENEIFEVKEFDSKSSNSPFIGEKLPGKIYYTICRGEVVYKN